jgi:LysM domain-containing protein
MPRVTARTLALALAVALPAPLLAQTPADVPETHTVKEGDTLWDLSRQYFGDALLWPRIYQMNTAVVEDPHWIYPGEILHLKSEGAVTSVPASEVPVPSQEVAQAAPDSSAPADTVSRESAQEIEPPAAEVVETTADTEHIFPRSGMRVQAPAIFRSDFVDSYRAVTPAEFNQAGFLTEGKDLPYGEVRGTIAPAQVDAQGSRAAMLFSQVAIRPPAPGAYQIGDSLLSVVLEAKAVGGNGQVVTPTGLIRVTDVSRPELIGVVVAQYGAINPGDRLIVAEKYEPRRGVRATPVADGLEGTMVAIRGSDVLRGPGDVIFIDQGREAGIRIGDQIEMRRTVARRNVTDDVVPEIVARLQVIHLGDRTATARVTWVAFPDIPVGTRWKVVARLPG